MLLLLLLLFFFFFHCCFVAQSNVADRLHFTQRAPTLTHREGELTEWTSNAYVRVSRATAGRELNGSVEPWAMARGIHNT